MPGTPASATSNKLSVDVSNGVAIRVVDKTGTSPISTLELPLITTPTGAFVSDYFNVEVSTSNITGYKLYMSTEYQIESSSTSPSNNPSANPSTNNTTEYTTALVNLEDSTYTIPTLASTNVSKSDFSASGGSHVNRWGYSINDTLYNPVPTHDTTVQIKDTGTEVNKELVPVYVGINANMDKTSGIYRNKLVFSAIPNPIPTEYSLYFQPGTTDTVTNLPATQTASEVAASHTFTIPSTAPTRAGYNFTGYLDQSTSTTYQPGDTITVMGNEEYTGEATLTATWSTASYTVSITNSNTTSGASSLSIPYGGSKSVTVTPSSGYYLSSVSCPSGYSCTGYNTGSGYTGQQTVTVTNNNATSGGTLGFGGTALTLAQMCANQPAGYVFYYPVTTTTAYIKMNDGGCYTMGARGPVSSRAAASAACPAGTSIPSQAQINNLLSKYSAAYQVGSTALWNNTGLGPAVFWTSTTPTGTFDVYSSGHTVVSSRYDGNYYYTCKVN